jgi:hypothetical protein
LGLVGIVAGLMSAGSYYGPQWEDHFNKTINGIAQMRTNISKARMQLYAAEQKIRSIPDDLTANAQQGRLDNIRGLNQALLPDCASEWGDIKGKVDNALLNSADGFSTGWQQQPLDNMSN